MTRLRIYAMFISIVVAIALAGCGGGSSGSADDTGAKSSTTTSTPKAQGGGSSKSKLVADADAICRRLNAEIAARETPSSSYQEIIRVVPGNAALERKAAQELARLSPPASLAHDWQQILAHRRKLAADLLTLVKDAKRNDELAVQALIASKKHTHSVLRAIATRDGFSDCAEIGVAGKPTPAPRLHKSVD